VEIKQEFLTKNEFSRPGKILSGVSGIVVHWVGNPKSTAKNNRDYFEGLKNQNAKAGARYASAHFVIGLAGEIIQCLPENEWAYHVGADKYSDIALAKLGAYPNNQTLGIELCHEKWDGKFTPETLASCRELAAVLLKKYNLAATDIYRHFDITGKDCPRYFVQHEDEWSRFVESAGG
jgi:N-acetylmuramoyl-L-alanine amidase